MGVLDYQMMIEVFLFLSVFDKWKYDKVTLVSSPSGWLILRRIENPNVCVHVSCVVACDHEFWKNLLLEY